MFSVKGQRGNVLGHCTPHGLRDNYSVLWSLLERSHEQYTIVLLYSTKMFIMSKPFLAHRLTKKIGI